MPDRSGHQSSAAVAAMILLALAALGSEFLIWPDWDTAWLIAAARMIRGGATLYSPALIEVNPPSIIEFARASLVTSDLLGISAVAAWRWQVFAVEVASLLLAWHILSRLLTGPARAWRLPAGVLLSAGLACLPGINFGQREHLVLLLATPYVLASAAALDGVPLAPVPRIAAGIMLAAALSLKPYYLLLVAAVEVSVLLAGRHWRAWWRVDLVTAAVVTLVLAVEQLLRYPGYLTTAVPFAWRFYRDYGRLQWHDAYAAYGIAGLLPVLALRQRASTAAPRQLFVAGSGAFIALAVQGKGFDYHFVPARGLWFLSGSLAALVWLAWRLDAWRQPRRLAPSIAAVALSAALIVPLGTLMVRRTHHINASHWPQQFAQLQQVIAASYHDDRPFSMTTLSVELFPAFPVVEVMGGRWASRYSCLWTVPAIEARERAGAGPDVSGRSALAREIRDDLVTNRPTFVLVQAHRSPVLDGLLARPEVHETLQTYRKVGEVGDITVWQRAADHD